MNKNHLISLVSILLFTSSSHPQKDDLLVSKDSSLFQTPQKVYRSCYVIESRDWHENQKRLWKAELIKEPLNEEAWRNYYFAAGYARMGTNEAER